MPKRILVVCFILIFAIGCATSSKRLNSLEIGMTKANVLEILGEPIYTSAVNDVEILTYKLKSGLFFKKVYHIKIINDKVEQFGKQGSSGFYSY